MWINWVFRTDESSVLNVFTVPKAGFVRNKKVTREKIKVTTLNSHTELFIENTIVNGLDTYPWFEIKTIHLVCKESVLT